MGRIHQAERSGAGLRSLRRAHSERSERFRIQEGGAASLAPHRQRSASLEKMISRWLDRIVLWLITLLILATPLAVGSVEPWGYSLAEVAIFVLIAALGARILCGRAPLLSGSGVIAFLTPLGLFIPLAPFLF